MIHGNTSLLKTKFHEKPTLNSVSKVDRYFEATK